MFTCSPASWTRRRWRSFSEPGRIELPLIPRAEGGFGETGFEGLTCDNMLGASDDLKTANPQSISGGSIVIQ